MLAGLMLLAPAASAWEANLNTGAVYSWIGNDFTGQERSLSYPYLTNQVMHDVAHLVVTPDGTAYTNVEWEENGQNFTEIQNGVITHVGENSHGWGYEGGNVVAANSEYVYFSQIASNEGGGLYDFNSELYPPKGYYWYGVQRRLRSDIRVGANFEGGIGKWGAPEDQKQSFLKVLEVPDGSGITINGMAAGEEKLFISVAAQNRIYVYDAETMQLLEIWEDVPGPGNMALDREGNLWVILKDEGCAVSYTQSGEFRTQKAIFSDNVIPQALCFDKENRLYISDIGIGEQILIFDHLETTPTLSGTFGEAGGIYSGISGQVADRKFNHITGIGIDDNNQLVVANGGRYYRTGCSGSAYIEGYDLNTGEKLWDLHGLFFVDQATFDREQEEFVYSSSKKFRMDYSKSPGEEWSYEAWTLNPVKYPDDPRLKRDMVGGDVLYLGGQKFLVLEERDGNCMAVYRFEEGSEIAIPCGYFGGGGGEWPPGNPGGAYFAWFDINGDGQFQAEEYTKYPSIPNSPGRKWQFDGNGDLWRGLDDSTLLKLPFLHINEKGVPIWGGNSTLSFETMAYQFPGYRLKRVYYDSQTDTMYLGLNQIGREFGWRLAGEKIVAYAQWTHPRERRMLFHLEMPEGEFFPYINCNDHPIGFTPEGDYLFVGYACYPFVCVLDRYTGEVVDMVDMPMELSVASWGLVDVANSYQVKKLQNGEYAIFIEDDLKTKNWMIRWTDQGVKNFNGEDTPAVLVNTRQLVFSDPEPEPVEEDGQILASISYVCRALGISVREISRETSRLILSLGETRVILTEGEATVGGGLSETLSKAPVKENGVWIGPVGEIARLFGLSVTEDASKNLMNINTAEDFVTLHGAIEMPIELPLPYTASAVDESRISSGEVSVTVSKNLSAYQGDSVWLIAAAYDADGRLADLQWETVSDTLEIGSAQDITITGLEIPEGGTAKAFLWNGLWSMMPWR